MILESSENSSSFTGEFFDTDLENSTFSTWILPPCENFSNTNFTFDLPWENIVAGTICTSVSAMGLFVNLLVTSSLLSMKRIRNPFTILCASLLLADAGILLIFIFWSAPMSLTLSPLSCSYVGKKVGQLSNLFWFSSMYCTLFLSASRLFAIANPTSYRAHFSKRNTLFTAVAGWLLASVHTIVYFFDGCDFYYDNEKNSWKYSTTTCGQIAEYVFDLGYGLTFFCFVFVLNVLAAWQIRRSNIIFSAKRSIPRRQEQESELDEQIRRPELSVTTVQMDPPSSANGEVTNTATGSHSSTTSASQRSRAELRMFKLSVIHAAIFELMIISFHFFSRLAQGNRLAEFFATTFAWQASHAANAFLIMYYSRDAKLMCRKLHCRCCCCWSRQLNTSPASAGKGSVAEGQSSRF